MKNKSNALLTLYSCLILIISTIYLVIKNTITQEASITFEVYPDILIVYALEIIVAIIVACLIIGIYKIYMDAGIVFKIGVAVLAIYLSLINFGVISFTTKATLIYPRLWVNSSTFVSYCGGLIAGSIILNLIGSFKKH